MCTSLAINSLAVQAREVDATRAYKKGGRAAHSKEQQPQHTRILSMTNMTRSVLLALLVCFLALGLTLASPVAKPDANPVANSNPAPEPAPLPSHHHSKHGCSYGSYFIPYSHSHGHSSESQMCQSYGYSPVNVNSSNDISISIAIYICIGGGHTAWVNSWYGQTYQSQCPEITSGSSMSASPSGGPTNCGHSYPPVCQM